MSLKNLVRSVKGPETLISKLELFVAKMPEDERAQGWHPSSFCGMCARREVIAKLVRWPEEAWNPSPQLRRIFDLGTALHERYQNGYLGEMGILWGKWGCTKCAEVTKGKVEYRTFRWGLKPRSDEATCVKCRCETIWWYLEVPVKASVDYQDDPIVGHSDGLILIGGEWWTVEIKSINERGFVALIEPKRDHLKQARIYTEMIRQGLIENLPTGLRPPVPIGTIVLYIGKNTSKEKEYQVKHDEGAARNDLKQPMLYGKAFHYKALPPKNEECVNMFKNPAKACDLCSFCFGGMTWEQLEAEGRRSCKIAKR